jgi:hypothetical protein
VGDLLALFADRLFQSSDFAKQLNQQSFKLRAAQIGKWDDGGTSAQNRTESVMRCSPLRLAPTPPAEDQQ